MRNIFKSKPGIKRFFFVPGRRAYPPPGWMAAIVAIFNVLVREKYVCF
jgi:hypothetical protein